MKHAVELRRRHRKTGQPFTVYWVRCPHCGWQWQTKTHRLPLNCPSLNPGCRKPLNLKDKDIIKLGQDGYAALKRKHLPDAR